MTSVSCIMYRYVYTCTCNIHVCISSTLFHSLTPSRSCRDVFEDSSLYSTPYFVNVDYATARTLNYWIDALSASFAAVQVLYIHVHITLYVNIGLHVLIHVQCTCTSHDVLLLLHSFVGHSQVYPPWLPDGVGHVHVGVCSIINIMAPQFCLQGGRKWKINSF